MKERSPFVIGAISTRILASNPKLFKQITMITDKTNIEDLAYAKYLTWKQETFIYKFKAIAKGVIYVWRFNTEDGSVTPLQLDYEQCRSGWSVYNGKLVQVGAESFINLDEEFRLKGID